MCARHHKQFSLANDFLQRTLMFQDIIIYFRPERVTKKMTRLVSNVSVCYTFFREKYWKDP